MSDAELALAWQLKAAGLPEPVREHRFHPTRRWKFDFAWQDRWLAVECEGGAYVEGRHSRGPGFEADLEKYAEATAMGWTVLRCSPRQIEEGRCLAWIERLLAR